MSAAGAAHSGERGMRAGMEMRAGARAGRLPRAFGTGAGAGRAGRSSGPCMCCWVAGKRGAVAPVTLLAHYLPAAGSMPSIYTGPGAMRVPTCSATALPAHGPPTYLRLSTLLI